MFCVYCDREREAGFWTFCASNRDFILPVQLLSQLGQTHRVVLHIPQPGLCFFCKQLGHSRVTDDFVTFHFCTTPFSFASKSPSFFCASAYPGACQQVKRRKDAGENRIRPGGKRVRIRHPKLKDGGGKGQSLLTQVLDKGRFVRLDQSTSLTPGRNIELRCKGNSIGWSYPTNLDTFNDSRLRCLKQTSAVGTL